MLVNESSGVLMVLHGSGTLSNEWNRWALTISDLSYLIEKPILLYLAFLRCRTVFEPYRKHPKIHYTLIGLRAIELFITLIVNIYENISCNESVMGPSCSQANLIWKIRDGMAPTFRLYYIISESIFYVKLFQTLSKRYDNDSKGQQLLRLRRYQTLIFTLDLICLISMSVYRILILVHSDLPTYIYLEIFSSALTVFVLTEFGLSLPEIFKLSKSETVISEKNSSGDVTRQTIVPIPQSKHLSPGMKNSNSFIAHNSHTDTFGLIKSNDVNNSAIL
ncbi:6867_t:CDS:1 [Acaulospora colombiana]|uniref:6867_t:CDS:1 n=1 Tax=Acaulospora colombiana TaxID=27376 RepID=A0ACA9M7Z4_9GLOM|nr:6867_t:CDS:1 [Acaulospora colombiana]